MPSNRVRCTCRVSRSGGCWAVDEGESYRCFAHRARPGLGHLCTRQKKKVGMLHFRNSIYCIFIFSPNSHFSASPKSLMATPVSRNSQALNFKKKAIKKTTGPRAPALVCCFSFLFLVCHLPFLSIFTQGKAKISVVQGSP
jgi:hypothetical protein